MVNKRNKTVIRILAMILCLFLIFDGNSILVLAEGLEQSPFGLHSEVVQDESSNEISEEISDNQETEDSSDTSEEERTSEESAEGEKESATEETDSEKEEISEEFSEESSEESSDEPSEEPSDEPSEEPSEELSEEISENSTEEPTEELSEDATETTEEESENSEEAVADQEETTETEQETLIEGNAQEALIIDEGKWGEIKWSMSADGELKLEAPQSSYILEVKSSSTPTEFPWDAYRDRVKSIYVNATAFYKHKGHSEVFIKPAYHFSLYKNLEKIDFGPKFKAENYDSVSGFFFECENLKEVNLKNVNISNAESISSMFYHCKSLKSVDLSGLDTGKVKDMEYMFSGCTSLEKVDLSSFSDENIMSINWLFEDCVSLVSVNFGDIDFQNETSCINVFTGCVALKELDLSRWRVQKIGSNSFEGATSLEKIITPSQLKAEVLLPNADEKYVWLRRDTNDIITKIPKNTDSLLVERELFVPVTKIEVERDYYEMDSYSKNNFKYTVYPENASSKNVTFESEKRACASIETKSDGTHFIDAKEAGTTTLKVVSKDGKGAKATIKVKVVDRAEDYVIHFDTLTENDEYIFLKGKKYKPEIKWYRGEAWPGYVMEFSNDTAVEENGKIVAKEIGSGTVTTYVTQYEEKFIPKKRKYRVYDPVDGIDLGSDRFLLDSGNGINQMTITGKFTNPKEEMVYGGIKYTLAKNDNFWMHDNGDNTVTVGVYENKPGKAVLTASSEDGSGVKKVFTVTNGTFVSNVKISAALDCDINGNYLLRKGSSIKLITEVQPKEATNKKLVYSSSDKTVATVDSKGTVKALKEGTVVITAKTSDESGVSTECRIRVTRPAKKVTMLLKGNSENKICLTNEDSVQTFTLNTIVTSDGETTGVSQEVDYTISGEGARNVVYKGNHVFEAKAPGVVTITATTKDGSKKKASLKVKVEQSVYAFEVLAPKNIGNYIDESGNEHWIVYAMKKNLTLNPQVVYNNASTERPADKAYQNYVIEIPASAKEVITPNKKGTGIIIVKNASPGSYEVTFRNTSSNLAKRVWIDVVEQDKNYIKTLSIGWPSSVKEVRNSAQPVAAGTKIKLNGILNNGEKISGYSQEWALEGEGNKGSATVKSGLLDLTKAVSGDRYKVILTVSRKGESKSATKEIVVTQRVKASDISMVTADKGAVALPSSLSVQSDMNNRVFRVAGLNKGAELYRVSGGKKGILNITEESEGFRIQAVGVGTAKISIAMLDGSNVKKDISIKVVSADNPVTKLSTSGKIYYMTVKEPIAIPYTLTTKNGGEATDARVEWKSSSGSVLKLTNDISTGADGSCITTEENGYLWLVPATEMTGKVTVTGSTLDGNKKSVTITVYVVNNSKWEVPDGFMLKVPAKTSIDKKNRPIVLHGKSLKLQPVFSTEKVKNKKVVYSLTGKTKANKTVTESELKGMGVTIKNGTVSVTKKSTFHGVVTVKACLDYKVYRNGKAQEVYTEKTICVQPAAEIDCICYVTPDGKLSRLVTESDTHRPILDEDGMQLYVYCSNGVNNLRVKWEVSDPKRATIDGNGVIRMHSNVRSKKDFIVTATVLDGSKRKIVYKCCLRQ